MVGKSGGQTPVGHKSGEPTTIGQHRCETNTNWTKNGKTNINEQRCGEPTTDKTYESSQSYLQLTSWPLCDNLNKP